MAQKRPATMDLQSNDFGVPAINRLTSYASASEVSNCNGVITQRTVQNRAAMSTIPSQHIQQQHHQQRTLVKARGRSSAAMTSSLSTISSATTTTSTTSLAHAMPPKSQVKHWQEELMEFSTQITRQAHFTLARIANYFYTNGMKFDANFRNHFLYISNNRLSESYDSFLIGLSRDMKCNEYQMQRPTAIPQPVYTAMNRQQSSEPLAKRKCIANGTAQAVSRLTVIKKPSMARLSKSMSQIGTSVSIQKVPTMHPTATAPSTNVVKIQKMKSLHQSAIANASAHSPMHNDSSQPKKTGGVNAENGSAKKVHVISTSKIPGRTAKILIPVSSISAAQVNAQSTPNRSVAAAAKQNSIPEDPLKIDDTATTPTPEVTIEPTAFVKEVTLHQTNKQLSTSLPLIKSNRIVTRSRNNNSKPSYKCDLCEFTTEVEQNFMRHSLAHTADKPRMCHVCKKRFPRKSLLLAHMREYHQELHSDVDYWESYE